MTFHVGQKVLCVDSTSPAFFVWDNSGLLSLKVGEVYIVTATTSRWGQQSIQCAELPNINSLGGKRWYQAKRFRPVVERKTSIELFHQIRRDVENNVPAELVGERA